jgi:hypothetical protein
MDFARIVGEVQRFTKHIAEPSGELNCDDNYSSNFGNPSLGRAGKGEVFITTLKDNNVDNRDENPEMSPRSLFFVFISNATCELRHMRGLESFSEFRVSLLSQKRRSDSHAYQLVCCPAGPQALGERFKISQAFA